MSDRTRVWAALLACLLLFAVAPTAAFGQQQLPDKVKGAAEDVLVNPEDARASEVLPDPTRRPERAARGVAKMKELRGTAKFEAGGEQPPELPGIERAPESPDPPSGRRSDAPGLLRKIEASPGGKEVVERARQRARSGSGSASAGFVGAGLGGGMSMPLYEAGAVPLDVTIPWNGGFVSANGGSNYWFWCGGYSYTYNRPFQANAAKCYTSDPYVMIVVRAPEDGWYILNVYNYGYSGANIEARIGSTVLQNFASSEYAWVDMPVLVELSTGYHAFYYYVRALYWQPNTVEFFGAGL